MLGASLGEPIGELQSESAETADQQIRLVRVAGEAADGRQRQRVRSLVSNLDQHFADMFAGRHVTESLFHLVPTEDRPVERANGAGFNTRSH